MTHKITRPCTVTTSTAQAARIQARREQALRNMMWEMNHYGQVEVVFPAEVDGQQEKK